MPTHKYNDPMRFGFLYSDNPTEWRKLWARENRRKNPIRELLCQAKKRCKKSGLEFDITEADLPIPEICPIREIKLQHSEGGRESASYSLDRVDNSKGYVKGNVRIISMRANLNKSDMSIRQVERLLAYMKGEL